MIQQQHGPDILIRPASIAIRVKAKQYNEFAKFYTDNLGAGKQTPAGLSFRMPGKDMEILLVKRGNGFDKNMTVVYWEVSPDSAGTLRGAHKAVRKYLPWSKQFEEPGTDTTELLERGARRSAIEDGSGNLVGLTINPPYPFTGPSGLQKTQGDTIAITQAVNTHEPTPTNFQSAASTYALPAALLAVGLGVGFVLGRKNKA